MSDVVRMAAFGRRYRAAFTGFAALAVAVAPLFIVGVLSVSIREDFGSSRASLGFAVSAFMAVAVVTAPLSGRIVDRFGVNVTVRSGLVLVLAADLLIGLLADSSAVLRSGMAIAGLGLSLVDAGTTLDLKLEVREVDQALAFGMKEIAGPITTLGGGVLIVPLASATSWQGVFVLYAGLSLLLLVLDLNLDRRHGQVRTSRFDHPDGESLGRAVLVGLATALAMVGITAVTTYGVDASIVGGMTTQHAALWITVGSAGAIVARILTAVATTRSERLGAVIVAALVLVGGVGHGLLAWGAEVALGPGSFIALVFGWGWGGVLFLFVIRLYPFRTGRAMGVVFMGAYAGGVIGPPIFGHIVDTEGFATAWWSSAGCMFAAGLLLLGALKPLRTNRPVEALIAQQGSR